MSTNLDRFAPMSPDDWNTRDMTAAQKAAFYETKSAEEIRQRIESLRAEMLEMEKRFPKLDEEIAQAEADLRERENEEARAQIAAEERNSER